MKLASRVYRNIPREERKYEDFCFLKSKAIALVKQGLTMEEIMALLMNSISTKKTLQPTKPVKKESQANPKKKIVPAYTSVYVIPYGRTNPPINYKRMAAKEVVACVDSS